MIDASDLIKKYIEPDAYLPEDSKGVISCVGFFNLVKEIKEETEKLKCENKELKETLFGIFQKSKETLSALRISE